jgi:hypothetical protein
VKVTVPVGVPVAGGTALTVAVKVTGTPTAAGFADEFSAAVASPRTTWLTASDVPLAKLPSPPYQTMIVWVPCESALVEKAATPFDRVWPSNGVAGMIVASRNVTVPVGVTIPSAEADTVAVKVTD